MLFRTLTLKAAGLPIVRQSVRRSRSFQGLVSRFIAGETLEEALKVAEGLAEEGFLVSLDLLGENVATETEALASLESYQELLRSIKGSPHADRVNISIKLTALGLDQSVEFAEANLRSLLTAAALSHTFVRVDMEGADYTERTVSMLERVFKDFQNTGTVLQSYMYRTDTDIERLIRLGCRIRLVKGAYLEPSSIAYQDKSKVDDQFVLQAMKLMKRAKYPAIATHDEGIINHLVDFAIEERIDQKLFEWQMLYGIRRDLQARLRDEGFNVRVYVPFGAAWYPYFSRRLAERPANLGFIAKSLLRK